MKEEKEKLVGDEVEVEDVEEDELVQRVSLYRTLRPAFHGYALPFAALYAGWTYVWLGWYGLWQFYEGGLVGVAAIACLQILLCLCCHWSVHVQCFVTCRRERDPSKADAVKVVPTSNNGSSELIRLRHDAEDGSAWFAFQKTKYVLSGDGRFRGLRFPTRLRLSQYAASRGLGDEADILRTERLYGKNRLDMSVPEFGELFKERATAPFFVFQVFCVALWCMDKYWYYSIFTLVMLVLFECTLVQQQLRNMAEIRKMGNKPYSLLAYRGRRWRSVSSDELLPGDIVSVTRSHDDRLVPCDLLLLRGPCIVDESMLTGESVPQMKEALLGDIDLTDEPRSLDLRTDGRLHVLYGGTKVVQHAAPPKQAGTQQLRAPDNGCVAYVLRTGFGTSQGRLLRTILFGVKRVTANNLETFGFILFLLVFALAAAAYVWTKGVLDPARNRYKLFLECTLILTSVVPPELPIELSLAVNTSLLALSKLGVFCTEPFRIPFAGKVDVCCFDKTGTLTSDALMVEGVAGVGETSTERARVTPISEGGTQVSDAAQVLATCHSLVQLDDGLVGDPLEKATLTAADWTLTRADAVIPKKGRGPGMKIFQRHHFSSALKRMCVVAGYNPSGSTDTLYIATAKGAPETLKPMFATVPEDYDAVYLAMSRRGARVLALGRKELGALTPQEVRALTREQLESELGFAGFVVISCPLKPDSKGVIREIASASHRVVMITGDNPLTACHVARELDMCRHRTTLVLEKGEKEIWNWESIDGTVILPEDTTAKELSRGYDLCVTGDGMEHLRSRRLLDRLIPHVVVFARFAPKQKELAIVTLKALGYTTLMCGDGTNDVGALKHAHVGVAILSSPPAHQTGAQPQEEAPQRPKRQPRQSQGGSLRNRTGGAQQQDGVVPQQQAAHAQIQQLMRELEEQQQQDQLQVIKLGDASIASPFTSKLSSIQCICHIIKQGRCTLVTTLQMFKILALNALILAYTQSVLYLDGIKLRDMQATLQGLLLAACFLFISRSKPVRVLSRQRPLPNIFNLYTILTVLLQFAVHFLCLVYLVQEAKRLTPQEELDSAILANSLSEEEQEQQFKPNIVNSTVYIISMALQIATFAINYRGQPYMESLAQNRALLYSIVGSGGTVLALALGLVPELAQQFEIIDFPSDFRIVLVQVLFADFFFSYLVDRVCLWLCGEGRLTVK